MNGVNRSAALKEALKTTVDEQRLAYNWSRISEKEQQRRARRGHLVPAFSAMLIGVVSAVGVFFWYQRSREVPPKPVFFELSEWTPVITVPEDASHEKRVSLSGGSRLTLAPGAELELKESSHNRIEMVLMKGWVRFNVTPHPERIWVVDAGIRRFVVLGTQFTVSRNAWAVKIAVHRGQVGLYNAPPDTALAKINAGETREFPAADRTVMLTSAPDSASPRREALATDERPDTDVETTVPIKPRGEPRARPGAMPKSPIGDLAGLGASRSVNTLLQAADDARKRKRYREAARLLGRFLREFPDDPAVGLVALTLGRIRLDTLHQPSAAARAFTRTLQSKGVPKPLREQAHARLVEALGRAGDIASAREMGTRYKRRYPNGVWQTWVEGWVGD